MLDVFFPAVVSVAPFGFAEAVEGFWFAEGAAAGAPVVVLAATPVDGAAALRASNAFED